VLKILQNVDAVANYESLAHFGLFTELFPDTDRLCDRDDMADDFVALALSNTAERIRNDLPVSPAFLYAALLWPPVLQRYRQTIRRERPSPAVVMQQAAEEVLGRAIRRVAIPKRFSIPMREIWLMQPRFEQQSDGRARRLMGHPRFRAAYDFLLLRAEVGEVPQALADWWTEAQTRLTAERGDDDIGVFDDAVPADDDAPPRKRRRRRRARTRSETPA